MMREKRGVKCSLCGKRGFSTQSPYCRECSHFCFRLSNERFSPEVCKSLKRDVRKRHGYYCHYTQQKLDVFDYTSPYFLEFDHVVPGDPKNIVKTSAWFNEMKGDMTLKELKGSVAQLYNYWFKGIKIKKKKFRYWYRLNP
jgi:hypothetical protein